MKPSHFGSMLLGVFLAAFIPICETQAQSVVLAGNEAAKIGLVSDRFAIGQSLVNPETVNIGSLDELIRIAAGQPRTKMFLSYGGDFERYWQASKSSFAGKAFEATLAHSMNGRLAELGSKNRVVVTAVEGATSHPADLLLVDEEGRIIGHWQSKLGASGAREALDDSKYAGMSIVTARDSLSTIEKELLKAEATAARRGIQLPEQWQTVREALASGRLVREPLPGLMLPTEADVVAGARSMVLKEWIRIARSTEGEAESAEASIGLGAKISTKSLLLGTDDAEVAGASVRFGKIAGGAFVVLDVGTTGILAYQDFQRFNEGEIGTGDYAIKVYLRGENIYLLYIAVADPEPTSKAIAMVALAALVAIDLGHDWLIDSRNETARQLLESIDREERMQAVRGYLLGRVRQLGSPVNRGSLETAQ